MDYKAMYKNYEGQIEDYCKAHNYSFEKLKHLSKGMNSEFITFQYHDKNKGQQGLKDDKTRMPVVLWVYINDGKLTFKETEHTKKYIMN